MIRKGSFDVLVCGGGPSGIAASLTAARAGLKVALVEQMGCFGGVSTSARVSHLLGGRHWDEPTHSFVRVVGGLFDEITDRLIAEGGAVDPDTIDVDHNPFGWYPRMAAGIACDTEQLKCLYDDLIMEAGVTPFLFSRFVSVIRTDDRITSCVFLGKEGMFSLDATLCIDATGDADLVNAAGCPLEKGRAEDGLMTPTSVIMHVDHVDGKEYVDYQNAHQSPKLVEIIQDLKAKGIWDFPFQIFIAIQLHDPDVFMVNTLRQIGVDGTKTEDLTRAMIQGRRDLRKLFQIMRSYFPGFEHARIRVISDVVGVRESRRIIGAYHVLLEDALQGKRYSDEVARTTYNFDLPHPLAPSFDPMMGDAAQPNVERAHQSIFIPYRSMVPQVIQNVLTTGRMVSVDREVLGALRVMGPMMMLGQAAGNAAVLAMRSEQKSFPTVHGEEVTKLQKQQGCLIEE